MCVPVFEFLYTITIIFRIIFRITATTKPPLNYHQTTTKPPPNYHQTITKLHQTTTKPPPNYQPTILAANLRKSVNKYPCVYPILPASPPPSRTHSHPLTHSHPTLTHSHLSSLFPMTAPASLGRNRPATVESTPAPAAHGHAQGDRHLLRMLRKAIRGVEGNALAAHLDSTQGSSRPLPVPCFLACSASALVPWSPPAPPSSLVRDPHASDRLHIQL